MSITREQVEDFASALKQDLPTEAFDTVEQLVDTDAALRQRIVELEQQVEGQVRERGLDIRASENTANLNIQLEKKIADLTAKLAATSTGMKLELLPFWSCDHALAIVAERVTRVTYDGTQLSWEAGHSIYLKYLNHEHPMYLRITCAPSVGACPDSMTTRGVALNLGD